MSAWTQKHFLPPYHTITTLLSDGQFIFVGGTWLTEAEAMLGDRAARRAASKAFLYRYIGTWQLVYEGAGEIQAVAKVQDHWIALCTRWASGERQQVLLTSQDGRLWMEKAQVPAVMSGIVPRADSASFYLWESSLLCYAASQYDKPALVDCGFKPDPFTEPRCDAHGRLWWVQTGQLRCHAAPPLAPGQPVLLPPALAVLDFAILGSAAILLLVDAKDDKGNEDTLLMRYDGISKLEQVARFPKLMPEHMRVDQEQIVVYGGNRAVVSLDTVFYVSRDSGKSWIQEQPPATKGARPVWLGLGGQVITGTPRGGIQYRLPLSSVP